MDPNFLDRLYHGYAAEHLISSELYARGFEVFRLPADFGLDLVVTNSFQLTHRKESIQELFPFCLQVKSRWLKPEDIDRGANGRPTAKCSFWLSEDEIGLLDRHKNSAVAFVLYFPEKQSQTPKYFILHSREFKTLIKRKYLPRSKRGYELSITYVMMPQMGLESLLESLLGTNDITPKGVAFLRKEIPPTFDRNWNATPYFTFAKSIGNAKEQKACKVTPSTDFSEFPRIPKLRFG